MLHPDDAAFAETGLRFAGVIRVGFIATIPLSSIEGVIGRVPEAMLEEALAHLCAIVCGK
jgi:hypothetical protein